jgi:nucleotide-binding universal stress UspA family protein
MTGVMVVGYDGSDIARAALGYAARRGGADSGLVVATVVPSGSADGGGHDTLHGHAEQLLEAIARERLGSKALETVVLEGSPSHALVDLAREREASDIAVGWRGFGPFRAALGSVSHALVHMSDRPVVVVPNAAVERERLGDLARGRPSLVVVGYDGSDNARAALAYAASRARAVGAALLAVCAYHSPSDWLGTPYYQRALVDHLERSREAVADVDEVAGFEVDTTVIEGPAASVLVRVAQTRDADEVIVGSRGHGRLQAALGSVSHELLPSADRPVTIVPHADGEAA